VSLTHHLSRPGSPVKAFLSERLGHTYALSSQANKQLRATPCACPPPDVQDYPYADVGRAIDYRIRYFYPAGAIDDLIAWKGGHRKLWNRYTTLAESNPDRRYTDFLRVSVEFFKQLDTFLQTVRPEGRLLDLGEEELLARYCYVLGVFELAYRSGDDLWFFYPGSARTVDRWLANVPQVVVNDLVGLARLFFAHEQDLLTRPVILNPTFAGSSDVGGADADLIIDGCLVDLKCTKRETLDSMWLRQLAGYVLLDYTDELRIHSVGIYMVRQGLLLSWPLEEFLSALSGGQASDVTEMRSAFRVIGAQLAAERLAAEQRAAPSELLLRFRQSAREKYSQ
jgi:hypothetical protein